MNHILQLLEFLLERKALNQDEIEELAGFLLQHSPRKWYRYQCNNPGCGEAIFSSKEAIDCFCVEHEELKK